MKKKFLLLLLFFLISTFLSVIFFNGVSNGQFLYIGDQFFRFNYLESFINSFFVRKLENLTVLNGWQFTTQFWDALYYLSIYKLNISFIIAEKILFFLVIFLSLVISFTGFKLLGTLFSKKPSSLAIFIVTIWYCFNPYPVMLWHGGVYNLGSALTYSLAPLVIYYFHITIFSTSTIRDKIICATLLSIASFTFWLFAPLAFTLLLYSAIYLVFNIKLTLKFLKNISILVLAFIPLVSFVLFNILYEYYGNAGNNNSTFSPTFGNQLGGIWYQVLLLFSWGIYTVWTPRAMYSFHEYYFSRFYIVPIIIMYSVIFMGYAKYYLSSYFQNKNRNKKTEVSKIPVVILLILFISLFLAKAAQPPLGGIFLYLYENIPFFSVFRTADIRFGFGVVLSISILMLVSFREFNKYIFSLIVLVILGFQSIFFFNGKAIKGENIKDLFYDRVVYLTNDYKDVINHINKDKSLATYALPLPAVEYGHYIFDKNEHHFGQDFLPKFINKQFVYLSLSNGISSKSYKELEKIIKNKRIYEFMNFPIKYVLLRQDIACTGCAVISEKDIGNKFKKVLKNKTFTLYEINNPTPIINSPNITFRIINPVKYRINFKNVSKTQSLQLLTSYNKDWKVFLAPNSTLRCNTEQAYINNIKECISEIKFSEGEEISYLLKKPLFENSHKLAYGYANQWTINPDLIKNNLSDRYHNVNKDGSISFDLIIYYLPQSWFYSTLLISLTSGSIMVVYLLRTRNKLILKSNKKTR